MLSRRSDSHNTESSSVSNVLPAYADSMGALDWVSSPTTASYSTASYSVPGNMEGETEASEQGIAMSKIEEFNSSTEHVAASLSAILYRL